jgi:hypothetical protein
VESVQLRGHQLAGVRGQIVRDPYDGCVRAVGRRERVIDVQIAVGGELARELRVVLLFLGMEPHVLQQKHLPDLKAADGRLCHRTHAIRRERHLAP